jgi:hypothetical protein
MRIGHFLTGAAMALAVAAIGAADVAAANLAALSGDRSLLTIDATPAVVRRVNITGLDNQLLGFDVRPADGKLYGLLASGRIVTINPRTGAAAPKVTLTLTTPLPAGARFSVDFNPVVDRLRIVSDTGTNLAANLDDGSVVVGTAPAFPPPPAVNPFGGVTPAVIAAAYTNSVAGAKGTLLFDIDDATDALYIQQPPAVGTLTNIGSQLGISPSQIGFDIQTDRSGRNIAYLISGNRLYNPRLLAGSAGPGTRIRGLSSPIRDLAVLP